MIKQAPNTTKFKFIKFHKVKVKNSSFENKSFILNFGTYGLQTMVNCKMLFKHIEAGRRSLRRTMQKKGNVWIKIFPWAPETKKSTASRMGKGKGKHYKWVCPLKKGKIVYEVSGVSERLAIKALKKCNQKMPFTSRVVKIKY